MTNLYKVYSNKGECLVKYATDEEVNAVLEEAGEESVNYRIVYQCSQKQFNAHI